MIMGQSIARAVTSTRLATRIFSLYGVFLAVFLSTVVVSHALLPPGALRNWNPLQDWQVSENLWFGAGQILAYNLISVALMTLANLFTQRRRSTGAFWPVGYTAFLTQILLNGLILGSWSFSVVSEPISLGAKILRTFDLAHRAGLWEMSGQLLATAATAHIALVITDGKQTSTRSWRTIRLSRGEIGALALGLVCLATGAVIESAAILAL